MVKIIINLKGWVHSQPFIFCMFNIRLRLLKKGEQPIMGYFQHKFGFKPFNEAEIDGQPGEEGQPADYTENETGEQTQPADTGGEESPDYTEQPNEGGEEAPAEEPTAEGEEGEAPPDYTEMEGGEGEEPPAEEAPPANEEEKPVDELKQQEEELYGLSTEKLELRHRELKKQYLEMYDVIVNIMDRISSSSVDEENIGVIEYVSETLSTLKTMIIDYIDKTYPLNSYIENSVNYNRFLAVLQGVNKILEDLDKRQNK